MASEEECIEAIVANVRDVGGNLPQMKEVDVGDAGKCLLIRHEDEGFTAIGHKCTHYGAPLARGALSQGIVRCPWHGACFNAKTGDIEDYPGLDSLQKYQVSVDKKTGDIKVKAKREQLKNVKRNSCLESGVDAVGKDKQVVIIGGGPASLVCAETLRKEGFSGKIAIVCKEPHPPYDRAKLSKALDAAPSSVYLRADDDYFKNINVDMMRNTEALSINTQEKKITLTKRESEQSDGDESNLTYGKLFIATGGKPRTLNPTPGWDCKNIFTLRSVDDANEIARASKDKNVVLVGSSFIGMEIAAYLTKNGDCKSVSVVCGKRSKVPFESSLGAQVGGCIMKMHTDKGVKFYPSAGVSSIVFDSEAKQVTQLKLSDESVVDADVVILGIGVTPCTDFLQNSGITFDDSGFIPVNARMQTNISDIYAGGDIVTFPLAMKGGEMTNIQHWQMAHTHGRKAGHAIVDSYLKTEDKSETLDSVPFFWTVQFGISIRYAGHGAKFDDVIIKGLEKSGKVVEAESALAAKKFVAFYVKGDRVTAIATMMADPIAARFANRLNNNGSLMIKDIDSFLRGDKGSSGKDKCTLS